MDCLKTKQSEDYLLTIWLVQFLMQRKIYVYYAVYNINHYRTKTHSPSLTAPERPAFKQANPNAFKKA